MKTVIVDLSEWRTRLTLEALKTLDDIWTAIIEAAAAEGDEDTAAAFGNNLMILMTLRAELEELATNACIPNIADLPPKLMLQQACLKVIKSYDSLSVHSAVQA